MPYHPSAPIMNMSTYKIMITSSTQFFPPFFDFSWTGVLYLVTVQTFKELLQRMQQINSLHHQLKHKHQIYLQRILKSVKSPLTTKSRRSCNFNKSLLHRLLRHPSVPPHHLVYHYPALVLKNGSLISFRKIL